MALTDLLAELPKDSFRIDRQEQKVEYAIACMYHLTSYTQLLETLIGLLGDVSGEVQGLAVRWYDDDAHSVLTGHGLILNHSIGGIVSKISDNGTAWLLAQLLSLISGASDQTRDLAALGMKSDERLEHEHI